MSLAGQRFGYLVAVSERRGSPTKWLCRCDCGNETLATRAYLIGGRKRSCGCKKMEMIAAAKTTHGMCRTSEYKIWKGMIKRCENPNHKDFQEYAGRGITVSPAWRNDFSAFFQCIGPRPSAEHSLDRIDNDRGYEPGNVRWATAKEQSNNRRRRRWAKKP